MTVMFSVIIVNYNGGDYLRQAIASLRKQTCRDFEVILVDNASTDGSLDGIDGEGLPALHILPFKENLGFAGGNNRAADVAKGTWLALLNPDAEATPDWLERVKAGTTAHPDTDSFACTQFSTHNPGALDGTGDNYLLAGFPWRGNFQRGVSDIPPEGECFSACGASAIIRRESFESLGGFDERLFCFCEDVDLGYRLRLQGGRCLFLPDACVYHAGGGLTQQLSERTVRWGTRNRLWVYLKNTPMPLLILTLPFHIALTVAVYLRGIFTGRARAVRLGFWDAMRGLGPVFKDRKKVQKTRSAPIIDILSAQTFNPMTLLRRAAVVRRGKSQRPTQSTTPVTSARDKEYTPTS